MPRTQKKLEGVSTIDVNLMVVRTGTEEDGMEYAVDTASKVQIDPQIETQDGVKNIKLGRVLAQKMEKKTVTGNKITITDNVFTPELVVVFNGGEVEGEGESLTYTPPASDSGEEGEIFEVDLYSAVYDSSGAILFYEKFTYPNCQGSPITVTMEDGVFRQPSYEINSAPKKGEPPFKYARVKELPNFSAMMANMMSATGMEQPSMQNEVSVQGTSKVSKDIN